MNDDHNLHQPLILIVDDEDTQRLLTRSYLEDDGYRVEEASDGVSGLDACARLLPDLVLLDVVMPGMDGFEVCRRLKEDANTADIPIMIVTGREAADDIERGFDVGAKDFLTKPVTWSLLTHRVRYSLAGASMARALKVAKIQAEQVSAAKSALLMTLSHELRTPLNSILGFSKMLQEETFGPLGAGEYLEFSGNIFNSGQQLLNTIEDMLEIVHSGAPVSSDSGQAFIDLDALLRSAVGPFHREAAAANINFEVDAPRGPVRLIGDGQRLAKAIGKLIANALAFVERDASPRIRVEAAALDDGMLRISVVDNGPGVPREALARIIEPFVQLENGRNRSHEGLGLGLSVAHSIVANYGGRLMLESEVGAGMRAHLLLRSFVSQAA